MTNELKTLEAKRNSLYKKLMNPGDFRRGTISINYRRCGKKNCACAKPDHPGHGPQYLWNATVGKIFGNIGLHKTAPIKMSHTRFCLARSVRCYRLAKSKKRSGDGD
ncbi:MAG: hypothetical protein KAW12_04350 [Candidatus Aminicenantes bacterium]|nr:hypothetical protein [Candidatus Aminicenantes bacterium]